jgi:hypothetical protein
MPFVLMSPQIPFTIQAVQKIFENSLESKIATENPLTDLPGVLSIAAANSSTVVAPPGHFLENWTYTSSEKAIEEEKPTSGSLAWTTIIRKGERMGCS